VRVLLVDDDEDFTRFAEGGLTLAGQEVRSVASGPAALACLQDPTDAPFDIILLDIGLGRESGMDLLEELRRAGNETPVIFVSGEKRVEHKVQGLRAGADDYVVKPIETEELVARMEAVKRRREKLEPVDYGEVRIDLSRRRVFRRGTRLDLSPREYDLLLALVRAKGEVVSRDQLLEQVWDMRFDPGTNVLDVHVGRLRRKLDALGGPLIENQRGRGYRILERAP